MQTKVSQIIVIVLLVLAFFAAVAESAQGKVDTSGISGKYTNFTPQLPAIQYRETVYRYFTVIEDRMPYNINDAGVLVVVELWIDLDACLKTICNGIIANDDGQKCFVSNPGEIAEFLTTNGLDALYLVYGG